MEYLPLGSIVILKEGKKKLIIYGRKQYDTTRDVIWDYVSCLYPEGNISPEYTFMFNHDDIQEVIFKGYEDNEDKEFQEVLNLVDDSKIVEMFKNS